MIHRIFSLVVSVLLFAGTVSAQDTVLYVDLTAPGTQSGANWTNAITDLQAGIDALVLATPPVQPFIKRLVVAEGVYTPTTSFFPAPNGDPRRASIVLPDATVMSIHGGFIGYNGGTPGTMQPHTPDGSFALTVLSGDLGAGLFAYHVVAVQGVAAFEVVLDGFTIKDGLADRLSATANEDKGAGAIVLGLTDILFDNVTFKDNEAIEKGGALYVALQSGKADLRFCEIKFNHAKRGAGIYYTSGPMLRMANVHIHGNGRILAPVGGIATLQGGGVFAGEQTRLDAANCRVYDNAARNAGGGIFWLPPAGASSNNFHSWKNCTITLNVVMQAPGSTTSNKGAGIHVAPGLWFPQMGDRRLLLDNCIVYGNRVGRDVSLQATMLLTGVKVIVNYSDIGTTFHNLIFGGSGELTLNNCISTDPLFRDVPARDLRLQVSLLGGVTSPCIDNGLDLLRGGDVLDIDDDPVTFLLPLDAAKNPRIADVPGVNGSLPLSEIIDMGAYEANVDAVPSNY